MEFECDEVAKIVSQTMNNYLMFNKLLKCELLWLLRAHKLVCLFQVSLLAMEMFILACWVPKVESERRSV